jgi:hypothetical protein
MYGFEAIAAHNGWAQAATGAVIVMGGLATLSIVISFLPKIFSLLEKENASHTIESKSATLKNTDINQLNYSDVYILNNLPETAAKYTKLIEPLGKSFKLYDLYQIFEQNDLPHPHLTIKSFREAGFIVLASKGHFTWKPTAE